MPSYGSARPDGRTGPGAGALPATTDPGSPVDTVPAARAEPTADAVEVTAPPARRRWLILVIVLCASIMDRLDATVVNVAGPAVRADIGGGSATVQWLAAGYTLAFAVFLITGGRLGDILGRRRMFLVGTVGFTVASAVCGLAVAPGELVAARIVQGAFGALLIPQGLGIIKAVFPPRELGGAFGAFAPIMGLASLGGPILAGTLIGADIFGTGWRMVFWINVPVGLAALAGAVFVLPRTRHRQAVRLDLLGVAVLTVAAVLVIYPLVQGRVLGWPAWTWAMLAGGALTFGLFVVYERTTRRAPIIEPSLLRNRTYLGGLAVAVVFFGAVAGLMLVLSVYAQTGLHWSPLHAALTGLPLALGIAGAGAAANKLIMRFGRRVLHAGLAVMILGLLLLAATVTHDGASVTSWTLVPGTAVTGVGMGLVFGPLFRTILGGISQRETGSASGTLSAVQQFGGSLGVAVFATGYYTLTAEASDAGVGMASVGLLIAAAVAVAFVLVFLLPKEERPASR